MILAPFLMLLSAETPAKFAERVQAAAKARGDFRVEITWENPGRPSTRQTIALRAPESLRIDTFLPGQHLLYLANPSGTWDIDLDGKEFARSPRLGAPIYLEADAYFTPPRLIPHALFSMGNFAYWGAGKGSTVKKKGSGWEYVAKVPDARGGVATVNFEFDQNLRLIASSDSAGTYRVAYPGTMTEASAFAVPDLTGFEPVVMPMEDFPFDATKSVDRLTITNGKTRSTIAKVRGGRNALIVFVDDQAPSKALLAKLPTLAKGNVITVGSGTWKLAPGTNAGFLPGFPCIVRLSLSGKVLGKWLGYDPTRDAKLKSQFAEHANE